MKYEYFEIPAQPLENCAAKPSVSSLQAQSDGTLLCGLAFARPLLFRVRLSPDKKRPEQFENLQLEERSGEGILAVTGGLRSTTSGDTALATLHRGFLPGFLRGILGGRIEKLSGAALLAFLAQNDGGLGSLVRHSVVQIMEKEISIRRHKEPGVLLDAAHIGDFIFGLSPSAIWREPYLNTEKRETLRGDLAGNGALHRDDGGTFWLSNKASRLLRLGQTEIKAKPTPLKLTEAELSISAPSTTDGWLYAATNSSRDLIRIRRNPVSLEEEMQKLGSFENAITGLATLEDEKGAKLVIALDAAAGSEIRSLPLLKADDPEEAPAIPTIVSEGQIAGLKSVSSLTVPSATRELWAGANSTAEKSGILRISGL